MDQDEIDVWGEVVLMKIHAITGWVIPEKAILVIFKDQFKKKLSESYPKCNPDEIEYAFRNTGTTVKDWGKSMNLSLIDEVMIPYLQKRFELSKIEEQQKFKELPDSKENISEMTMQDWFNSLKSQKTGIEFIPVMIYDWLDNSGQIKLTVLEKKEYMIRAKNYYLQNFNDQKRTVDECKQMLKNISKKIVVYDMINAVSDVR